VNRLEQLKYLAQGWGAGGFACLMADGGFLCGKVLTQETLPKGVHQE
jgi:hypothetical protein